MAVKECVPLLKVVVLSDCEYGEAVAAAPKLEPSAWNCTLAIPTLDDAVAVTVIVPLSVAPEAGDVIETVGFPALSTVIETAALVAVLLSLSVATAVRL
jgi:hypothetical protein